MVEPHLIAYALALLAVLFVTSGFWAGPQIFLTASRALMVIVPCLVLLSIVLVVLAAKTGNGWSIFMCSGPLMGFVIAFLNPANREPWVGAVKQVKRLDTKTPWGASIAVTSGLFVIGLILGFCRWVGLIS